MKPSNLKSFQNTLLLLPALFFLSCQQEQAWEPLFNGENLENWDTYLGTSLGAKFDSLAESAVPEKVFTVVEQDGENLIRISGEVNGSLATREAYGNYHLRLQYKWGEKVYSRPNSGLLYHSFGNFGEAHGTWMPNIEFQMMHQNLGDTYLMANTTAKIEALEKDGQFVYSPGTEMLQFGKNDNGNLIRKKTDNENPVGKWNTLELYCIDRTAVHVVNGKTVMVNQETGFYENGEIVPLTSGKIQIQSEGAELLIKSMEIKSISEIPEEFK